METTFSNLSSQEVDDPISGKKAWENAFPLNNEWSHLRFSP